MRPEAFAVYDVPENAPAAAELMGTKPKFWFSRDSAMWLFKASRPGTGEHWAEVVVAELARLLGLPHAEYELARWRDSSGSVKSGVVTRTFVPEGFDLVHGNELLAQRDPDYPVAGKRYIRTREHTIEAVRAVVSAPGVEPPIASEAAPGIETPLDIFGGYLLLDAWVGNTDRHHENWALVVHPSQGDRHLAPTFDHASSLGCHLADEQRQRRLDSRDPGYRVKGYVERADARSALYHEAGDAQPLTMLAAFAEWSAAAHCEPWLRRLAEIPDDDIAAAIRRVPDSEMTGPAKAFAQAMLTVNRERILGER